MCVSKQVPSHDCKIETGMAAVPVPWSFCKDLPICVVPTLDFPKGLESVLLGLEAAMYSGHIHQEFNLHWLHYR